MNNKLILNLLTLLTLITLTMGCNSPTRSQNYFIQSQNNDPMLEPLYTTPLYTIYYDFGLMRCVLHSSYTWGEQGGGSGGTGIGIAVVPCDPTRLKQRAEALRAGERPYEYPPRRERKKQTVAPRTNSMNSTPMHNLSAGAGGATTQMPAATPKNN